MMASTVSWRGREVLRRDLQCLIITPLLSLIKPSLLRMNFILKIKGRRKKKKESLTLEQSQLCESGGRDEHDITCVSFCEFVVFLEQIKTGSITLTK